MRIRDVLIRLIGARDPYCPNEADILAYSENRLSTGDRARVERHFANCNDCRQALAFIGREPEAPVALTPEAVSEQTVNVLAYIQRDERNRVTHPPKARTATGFYVSYPRLAAIGLLICAIAATGVYMITMDQSPADAAMSALRLSVKEVRYTEARISGGFDHSRYTGTTRGVANGDYDLNLSRAENKVKAAAERQNATVENRLVLARVYLAQGTREGATKALALLNQIAPGEGETPEALNDKGVAQFQMDNYDRAIAFFSEALAKSPAYNEALFNRALAEGFDRRNQEARRDWQQFISQSSDEQWNTEARNRLASLVGASDR